MRIHNVLLLFLGIVFLSACAPTRIVKTLPKGEVQVGGSFGGPLIGFAGTTIPVPFSSLSVAYGLDSSLSVFGGVHTTALAFGVIQTDLGLTRELKKYNSLFSPALSFTQSNNLFFDVWDKKFRYYPELGLQSFWEYGKSKHFAYAGVSTWVDFFTSKTHGADLHRFLSPVAFIGNTFSSKKWRYTAEIKYESPFVNSKDVVVDYKTFGKKGAIGVFIGINKSF